MKNSNIEIAKWFIDLVGIFGHYEFFTKELWRNIPEYENKDTSEVNVVFLHYWFHNQFGYYTTPIGMSWCSEVSKESYESYIERNKSLIKAFENWINNTR